MACGAIYSFYCPIQSSKLAILRPTTTFAIIQQNSIFLTDSLTITASSNVLKLSINEFEDHIKEENLKSHKEILTGLSSNGKQPYTRQRRMDRSRRELY
ncbi:hypothetical protein O181_011050 [Austropuccinia psidii MF-1]|uniref:Uncharacterized protein n=1 Tax=Austropuccinia psidii MF-1 TaxID=1389203 RepID=A0A9Q3BUE1_9BASI|nr:hypothetical protein [Austropuccinia psidii MF-1]